mmetsp:Transcript_6804/g.18999  ORF Transcript_6804/g.18999 Transcript_6804/m.18999 type:complete len:126 (+) Transcript_6804:181-558(+)|eukprot:CAMPEP_0181061036 /NCGR_PEP_ID=MMETSP1070-20121207/22301_1 /TAXON_ID=265543 /ORGANISM="Minutocellus polymorphus, Strain NH13" /LENGTH=125 /DNA_ID=CAMNT_0023140953 /DNA_START=160 /DNA_END=537 /DNA_ORIENTATION=-
MPQLSFLLCPLGIIKDLSMVDPTSGVRQRGWIPYKILVSVTSALQLQGESLGSHPWFERTNVLAEKSLARPGLSLKLGRAGLGAVGDELDAYVVASEGDAVGDNLPISDFVSNNVDDEVTMATVD